MTNRAQVEIKEGMRVRTKHYGEGHVIYVEGHECRVRLDGGTLRSFAALELEPILDIPSWLLNGQRVALQYQGKPAQGALESCKHVDWAVIQDGGLCIWTGSTEKAIQELTPILDTQPVDQPTDRPSAPRDDSRLTRLGLPQLTARDHATASPEQIRLMALCAGRPAEHPVLASVASLRDRLMGLCDLLGEDAPSALSSSLASIRDHACSVTLLVESYVETRDAE